MNTDDAATVLARAKEDFGLPAISTISPIAAGTNNRSFLITTADGVYVLKWSQNAQAADRLRSEHALLARLAAANLPFAVPTPIRTVHGETVAIPGEGRAGAILSLTRLIPGSRPAFGDPDQTRACGHALGILDRALADTSANAGLELQNAVPGLADVHPELPNPIEAIRTDLHRDDVADMLLVVEEAWLQRTDGWDTQWIHGDYYPSNVLMADGEVSGVLDFESAGSGVRAMDVAVGLGAFTAPNWIAGCEWTLVDAFAAGYLAACDLTPAEREAIPDLLLKRESISFVHWFGRQRLGLTSHADIMNRIERLVSLFTWLEANRSQLIAALMSTDRQY